LEVFDNFRSDDIGIRKIGAVFEAFVFEPEDLVANIRSYDMGEIIHQAKVTAVDETPPRFTFKWGRPQFTAEDGYGNMGKLSHLGELALAFGYMDDAGLYAVGSGVMIAPGILLTATHVIQETKNTAGMAFSFLERGGMRIWGPREASFRTGRIDDPLGGSRRRVSDVALVACELMSAQVEEFPVRLAHIELVLPRLGERLWAVGCRETLRDPEPGVTMLCASGLVTARFPDGRGDHLPNSCVEVSVNTVGGMSGGPVFNVAGHLVGIVSSSYEAEDGKGPTYVSLIWPAFQSIVTAPWPRDFWPDGEVTILGARQLGHARVSGDFTINDKNDITLHTDLALGEIPQKTN
jgi:hypothetical protein